MKTLKGVIAATTYADYQTPLADSNLFLEPWYFTLSSGLYAIEYEDSLAPSIVKPEFTWQEWQVDEVSLGLLPPKIYRRPVVKYWDYKNTPPESIGVGLLAPAVSRKTEVRYLVYDKAEPEQLSIGLMPPAVFRKKVADRFDYIIPEETISVGLLAPTIKRTNT